MNFGEVPDTANSSHRYLIVNDAMEGATRHGGTFHLFARTERCPVLEAAGAGQALASSLTCPPSLDFVCALANHRTSTCCRPRASSPGLESSIAQPGETAVDIREWGILNSKWGSSLERRHGWRQGARRPRSRRRLGVDGSSYGRVCRRYQSAARTPDLQ